MIDYIKYTVDGVSYQLVNNGDGTWSRDLNAPNIAGRYDLLLEIGQNGMRTIIDSSDPRYSFYLDVLEEVIREVDLIKNIRMFLRGEPVYQTIFDAENLELDILHHEIKKLGLDSFIRTASIEQITRLETFLEYKGQGTLSQRRTYLLALYQKSRKLNEGSIKEIVNTITGSDCIITFFGADEVDNPYPGYGVLQIQVLSPDNSVDYRYEDIERVLRPLAPNHIRMLVIRFFSTWGDIRDNFADWNAVMAMDSWQAVRDYIPPQ